VGLTHRKYWILCDRVDFANDNAEHLFRYLHNQRRDLACRYVLSKKAPQWLIMRQEFGSKVVPFGGVRWLYFYLRSRVVISSHLSDLIYPRRVVSKFMPWRSRFVFLGHGVHTRDFSRWFNKYPIDLLLLSVQTEWETFSARTSAIRRSTSLARITGLPRWDRLSDLRRSSSFETGQVILFAPTWPQGVGVKFSKLGRHKPLDIKKLVASSWFKKWSRLLRSTELANFAASSGKEIAFLAHPALFDLLSSDGKKYFESCMLVSFFDGDVRQILGNTSVIVTDYSSLAWDAAYMEVPVIYFQDEADERTFSLLGGAFQHRKHGFGPIAATAEEVLERLIEAQRRDFKMSPEMINTVRSTFKYPARLHSETAANEIEKFLRTKKSALSGCKRP